QFDSGGDAAALLGVIQSIEQSHVAHAGVPSSDIMRSTGSPQSGYALMLSRAGQREMQRRNEPQLRRMDLETINKSAALLNRWSERETRAASFGMPESGYFIAYEGIPLTIDEREANRDDAVARLDAGLASRVGVYMEIYPGTTEEQALDALVKIAKQEAALTAATQAADAVAIEEAEEVIQETP
ncbi:MAG: hypothetical protein GY913_15350, partial [Proteobacteria bacterium]|nr:hypothetical protein [Pseudomonadota bacterium]